MRGSLKKKNHNLKMRDCSLSEFSVDIFELHITGSSGSETEGEREGAGLPNKSPLV